MTSKDGAITAASGTEKPLELDMSSDLDAFLRRLASEAFSGWNAPEVDAAFHDITNITS